LVVYLLNRGVMFLLYLLGLCMPFAIQAQSGNQVVDSSNVTSEVLRQFGIQDAFDQDQGYVAHTGADWLVYIPAQEVILLSLPVESKGIFLWGLEGLDYPQMVFGMMSNNKVVPFKQYKVPGTLALLARHCKNFFKATMPTKKVCDSDSPALSSLISSLDFIVDKPLENGYTADHLRSVIGMMGDDLASADELNSQLNRSFYQSIRVKKITYRMLVDNLDSDMKEAFEDIDEDILVDDGHKVFYALYILSQARSRYSE